MPKYITGSIVNYQQALEVSGIFVSNDLTGAAYQDNLVFDPTLSIFSGASGIPFQSYAASGDLFARNPRNF